ncbi:MAG TPA: hypothetical protein VF677_02135 [Flavobacterium sp.]|jgi:hypothetical protein
MYTFYISEIDGDDRPGKRLSLTPFRGYDSIYLVLPNYNEIILDSIFQKKDTIDYLLSKNNVKVNYSQHRILIT